MRFTTIFALAAAFVATVSAQHPAPGGPSTGSGTLLTQLVANSNPATSGKPYNLTTLISLASGFSDVLALLNDTSVTLTLFAPTNAAIGSYLTANPSVAQTLTSTPSALLSVLQYHVVPGVAFRPASSSAGSTLVVKTALDAPGLGAGAKQNLIVRVSPAAAVTLGFGLGSARVVDSIVGSNGIIHVVDALLIPPAKVSETAVAANLTSLVGALRATDLVGTVDGLVNTTIFAPTNAAFQAIASVVSTLSPAQISGVLRYHVLAPSLGTVFSPAVVALPNNTKVPTVLGQEFTVSRNAAGAPVIRGTGNTADVGLVVTDVLVANGVVHVIDAVIIPNVAAIAAAPAASAAAPAASGASAAPAATGTVAAQGTAGTTGSAGFLSASASPIIALLVAICVALLML